MSKKVILLFISTGAMLLRAFSSCLPVIIYTASACHSAMLAITKSHLAQLICVHLWRFGRSESLDVDCIFVPNSGCRTELQRTLVLETLIFLTTAVSTFVKGMLMMTRARWGAARQMDSRQAEQ